MKKQTLKTLIIGSVIGGMLVSGVSYASSFMQTIEVSVQPVNFVLNGKEVTPSEKSNYYFNGNEYVPASFIYKGTTYVPLRFAGEASGQVVEWQGETRTIVMKNKAQTALLDASSRVIINQDFQGIDAVEEYKNVPQDVKDWVEKNSMTEFTGSMVSGDSTYLLIARGECNSGGYGIDIKGINEGEGVLTVQAEYTNPDPDSFNIMALTYPVALLKIDKTDKKIEFDITGKVESQSKLK